jgi:hypothetical protein
MIRKGFQSCRWRGVPIHTAAAAFINLILKKSIPELIPLVAVWNSYKTRPLVNDEVG